MSQINRAVYGQVLETGHVFAINPGRLSYDEPFKILRVAGRDGTA